MILFSSRIFIWACLISLALSCGPRFAFAEETIRRNVEVQWDAIVGASQYEVQVQNKGSDTKPLRFKTSVPKWSATIKPGFYIMTIRSFDDRGVPGTWSPPSELQVKLPSVMLSSPQPGEQVRASDDTTQDVKLRWEAVPGAEKYKVTLHSKISSYSIDQEVRDTSLTLSLPVGEEFEWNAIAVEPSGQIGDPNLTAQPFLLQGPALPKPNIEKPLSKYVREIKWSSSVNAKSYSYELLLRNPQTKKWDQIEHQDNRLENSIALDISRPSGRYRIKVQAKGERRDPSKIAQLDFAT